MTQQQTRIELITRLAAGAITVAGVTACHWLSLWDARVSAALPLFLISIVGAGLILFARGIGPWSGAVLGAGAGLSTSIALTLQREAPLTNVAAFTLIATGVFAIIGVLTGNWESFADGRSRAAGMLHDARPPGSLAPGEVEDGIARCEAVAAIAADFCQFVTTPAHAPSASLPPGWPEFDQFVRGTLRERLSAGGVRVFRVSEDGEHLLPLSQSSEKKAEFPSALAGPIGRTITSQAPYIAPRVRAIDAPPASDAAERWSWLLPLHSAERTAALIGIEQFEHPEDCNRATALAVRDLAQLLFSYVESRQALLSCQRTDLQSGVLNRAGLLHHLERLSLEAVHAGEPYMILALGVEGLRRLDDAGCWSQRDALIERIGGVLRARLAGDDAIGRFSDDRFIVILRRLDAPLGLRVAERLMRTVSQEVLPALNALSESGADESRRASLDQVRLRGGLAGTGTDELARRRPFPGFDDLAASGAEPKPKSMSLNVGSVLERALGLLDYARSQRVDIASDLMEGLPAALVRPAAGSHATTAWAATESTG